ncbi:MAG: sodium-dependent transporter, partial [Marinobacter sp.]
MTGSKSTPAHRGLWSSRMAFILAATGSAVGLGNIWKFPYVTGENGGGAFVLVYLLCIAIVGIPIMMAEVYIGRSGRHNPITSFRLVAERNVASPVWRISAIVGVLAAFIILSFYSVIGGWAASYVGHAAMGDFTGQSADAIGELFGGLLASPVTLLIWHTIFMALVIFVVA